MNSDGKDDYVLIGDEGSLWVWENQADADTSMTIDGVRFADIDGDGVSEMNCSMFTGRSSMEISANMVSSQLDDYVWLHPETGAATV